MDYARNPFTNAGIRNEPLIGYNMFKKGSNNNCKRIFLFESGKWFIVTRFYAYFLDAINRWKWIGFLDSVVLMLMGRDNPDDCSIHYNIPLDEYDFDDSCFLSSKI